jgi:2,4-dienoyl-CoA reductase (NADPH2)
VTAALSEPVAIGRRTAPSRLVFGPHETNLGRGRAISDRHVAYYARRAAGGAGVIITETASVTANDWPYERAPLASEAGPGWAAIAGACSQWAPLVLAGIGHAGGQGSSAYSQEAMWAPSAVADVVTREPPAVLEEADLPGLVAAFASAASFARRCGLAGVEVDAGAWSLLRQFHSGLTNQRGDAYGTDRLRFTRWVLDEVRRAVGPEGVVGLRLSCDELAPWAGVTPDQAAGFVEELSGSGTVDLLTVIRGGPYSSAAYRPDSHAGEGFNIGLCRRMREAAGGRVQVVLQGSVVAAGMAATALAEGVCDLVEMTRAQIADADLGVKVRSGDAARVRPCILCNQVCQVRDPRNPIVSCVVDPASGHETEEPFAPPVVPSGPAGGTVIVVGGGPAGMECARVLAEAGRPVRLVERSGALGGTLARAAVGPGRETARRATEWLAGELARLAVLVELGTEMGAAVVADARRDGATVVLATGSRPADHRYPGAGQPVFDALSVLTDPDRLPAGPVVVVDTVGDAVGVNLAEWLATAHGRNVTLVCPDPVAGTQLSRTGDLADANGRLQRAGVTRQLRSIVRSITPEGVEIEDGWTAVRITVPAASVVDCGHRLPDDRVYLELGDPRVPRAGDCVAPRSLLEAVLEGRRTAHRILEGTPAVAAGAGR